MCQLLQSVLPYYVDSVLPMNDQLLPMNDQLLPRATETQAGCGPTSAWSRLVAWLHGDDAARLCRSTHLACWWWPLEGVRVPRLHIRRRG